MTIDTPTFATLRERVRDYAPQLQSDGRLSWREFERSYKAMMSNTIISNYCDANSKPNPAINGNDIETLSKLVEWMIDNKLAVTS